MEFAAERIGVRELRPLSLAPMLDARSTIAMAFSHDGAFLASTHGDHTVRARVRIAGHQRL